MRKSHLPRKTGKVFRIEPVIIFFSVAFVIGTTGGYFCCVALGIDEEIKQYLQQYANFLTSGGALSVASLLGAVLAYYRFPCIVFLCGHFYHAFYILCGLFMVEGFLLSFAVANFSLALGRAGILISLFVFGIRAMFIIPISLSLALCRFRQAVRRQGRRTAETRSVSEGRQLHFMFLYPAILALGVMIELTFVPKLAAFALQNIS